MNLAEQFRAWALAPGRTDDERYTIELLVEAAQARADEKNKAPRPDFDAVRTRRKRRALNPAHRPDLSRAQLDLVVEFWAGITRVENGTSLEEDRPVRDLGALRFFPHVTTLKLTSELDDLAALAAVPGLKVLELHDESLGNFDGIAALTQLEEVNLHLGAPWPALAGLGRLPQLKVVNFRGNLLALREVPAWPQVERAWLHKNHVANTPLRDAQELPEMPRVTWLQVDGIAALRGIERFARVQQLDVEGPYVDLGPLAAMPEVRKLRLAGERFLDLRPVAHMPRLRTLVLWRYRGIDVSSLAESPRLREVEAKLSEVIQTEIASVNAAIGFVDQTVFVREEPLRLGPLRLIAYDPRRDDFKSVRSGLQRLEPRVAAYEDDPVMDPAECRWFDREISRRLNARLAPGWGRIASWGPGFANLTIRRYQDVTKLRDIVAAVREVIAAARFPWGVMLFVDPHGDLGEDLDEIEERHGGGDEDEDEFDVESEREEWEDARRRWREHREFLEREHRHRLQAQEGLPIEPEAFALPEPEAPPHDDDTIQDTEDGGDTNALGLDLDFHLEIGRDIVWAHADAAAKAGYFLEAKFEDWHALPGPPEQRPRPE